MSRRVKSMCPECKGRGQVDYQGMATCPCGTCDGSGFYTLALPAVIKVPACADIAHRRCHAFDPLEVYLPDGWRITPSKKDDTWTVESPDQINTGFREQWEALHYVWMRQPDREVTSVNMRKHLAEMERRGR